MPQLPYTMLQVCELIIVRQMKEEITMDETRWATALDTVRKYSFKILTPAGAGTGFLLTRPDTQGLCSVATAYHVLAHAYEWEEPLKLVHEESGETVVLRSPDRYIFTNPKADLAVIAFFASGLGLPQDDPTLFPKDEHIKPGIRIGWAGYPAVAPSDFCFFTGAVSCFLGNKLAYLVDGVAINGVSGGPAFCVLPKNGLHFIGVVTAYVPNRLGEESLPGVCFVSGIHPLYHVVKEVKSLEDAEQKAKQLEAEPDAGGDS